MKKKKIEIEAEKLICSYASANKKQIEDGHSTIPLRDPDEELVIPEKPKSPETCIYCNANLYKAKLGEKYKGFFTPIEKYLYLYYCINCGWWLIERLEEEIHFTGNHFIYNKIEGVVKHYNIDSYEVPIIDLRNYLKKHPNDIALVNPYRFELLMQDCFKDYFGSCEVVHVGRSGDGGIDLKIIQNNKETFLVQVKRRLDITKNEGPLVVRELNGVLFRENIPKGIIVTTAKGFTRSAYKETNVKTPTKRKYVMKLMAFDDVVSMLNLPKLDPYKPWEKCLSELSLKQNMIRY